MCLRCPLPVSLRAAAGPDVPCVIKEKFGDLPLPEVLGEEHLLRTLPVSLRQFFGQSPYVSPSADNQHRLCSRRLDLVQPEVLSNVIGAGKTAFVRAVRSWVEAPALLHLVTNARFAPPAPFRQHPRCA